MFKKRILILFACLLLAACARLTTPPDLQNRVSPQAAEITSFTGTLETIQLSLYQKGTHQILAKDGQKVIIASPTVNLSSHIGKEVVIKGAFETGLDPAQKVFIVHTLAEAARGGSGESKEYQSRSFGIGFRYPGNGDVAEENTRLRLLKGNRDLITIDLFQSGDPLTDFIKTREVENGTAVTIGGQPALRFNEGPKIRIYVQSPGQDKIVRLNFPDTVAEEHDTDQVIFYDLLDSFSFLYYKKTTGSACGGTENTPCEAGFRCELASGEKDAPGTCVEISATTDQPALCPFVATPKGCKNFKVSGLNADQCPVGYECLDAAQAAPATEGLKSVPTIPTQPPPPAEKPSSAQAPGPQAGLSRSYQNSYKNFTISYHKNWYFKSLGTQEGVLWLVIFADHSIQDAHDALISLKIVAGEERDRHAKSEEGVYSFIVPRDKETHFVLEGPSSFQALIEEMAQSLVQ